MQNSLVVISAPSGCGKDTIIERVCQRLDGIGVSISCTTRAPRPKSDGSYEQHGVDYFLIKRPEFEERICQNGFLEYANNKGDLYGTSFATQQICLLKRRKNLFFQKINLRMKGCY